MTQYVKEINGYKIKDELSIHSYDTVADMVADSKLKKDSHVKTKGYYNINDGGSAEYVIVEGNYTSDGGNHIVLTNGLFAELIINNSINVKQFGAKGDGTTDDSTPIQTAINTGKNIFFPTGNYLISNTLTINGRNNWKFDSSEATITYSGNDYAIEFRTIRNSNLYIGVIRATNGGCISFIGDSSSQYSQYVNVDFNTFISKTNCIYVENKTNCWISEFRINKGRFQSGNNGLYMLQNASAGISHWVFNNIGIEGVNVGFNFNVGEYAEANNHFIDSCEFNECRSGEADILFKNNGKVRKILWLGSHYVTPNQLQLTNEATWWKFIHAERINYVYDGVFYDRSIDVTSNITTENDIGFEGKVRMTDDLAVLNISIYGSSGEVALTQNKLLLSGLPKPKENIYFIAQNYGDNTQQQPRLYINTSGSLFAYWPGGAKLQAQNSPTYINLVYFKGQMDI